MIKPVIFLGLCCLAITACKPPPRWQMSDSKSARGIVTGTGHPSPIPQARGSYEAPDERDFLIQHSIPLPR